MYVCHEVCRIIRSSSASLLTVRLLSKWREEGGGEGGGRDGGVFFNIAYNYSEGRKGTRAGKMFYIYSTSV